MTRAAESILDEFLVLQAQAGVAESWSQLIERWHPLLVARATRLLGDRHAAADVAQETWVSVAKSLRKLEDPARFAPWIYRILARRCADHISRSVRRPERSADVSEAPAPQRRDDEHAGMRAAIARLPSEQRLLLSMRYADGVPLRVIAELLGLPEGTVKSRLHTARTALRAAIESDPATGREGV